MLNWLFGKKTSEVQLSHLGIDIHSHILPGIDDGVSTLEESVQMAQKMQDLGYQQIITTPHIMWDCYRNTPDIIRGKLQEVQYASQAAGLTIEIGAAAEYFIDEHFLEMLDTDQEFLTLPGNRLLVELPYSTPLMNTSESLFRIVEKGYRPVLAHPERYNYYHSNPGIYKKFCDQGCELQLNVLSLRNFYGEHVRKTAEWLLENQLITFVGTDAHKMKHLNAIGEHSKKSWLRDYPFKNKSLLFEKASSF